MSYQIVVVGVVVIYMQYRYFIQKIYLYRHIDVSLYKYNTCRWMQGLEKT